MAEAPQVNHLGVLAASAGTREGTRKGRGRTGQDRAGQGRTGQDKTVTYYARQYNTFTRHEILYKTRP